ncbi:inactive dipeptidyl peptidase 10 isoform X1 [Drosophila sulfurigaster albostrigata]|uniref:inactive dipeptidyl peptidase 10 isoform X1 n=1 Tax=Drosophila sulfurigaster albostrigata TaxID=89887 RepID=UPI002D21AF7B|nr:inactive dipeptidyl peptidase 10 isoform X1 [Drosophila sulfurigaster albostrigata]
MVEIQKPHSALKRPSLKRETVVVNNSAPTIKKVTLVPKDEELVAISPERRNWRGIFIALLVIAAVFSLIIFSIFLLSPEDEGLRIRGRRMLPSDILSKSLQWKPFNGTWSNDHELVYRDPTGGLSILNMADYTTRILMTNSTFRQLNAESFLVAPDQKYVLLQSDSNAEGSRHHVYEVQTANTFPLGPTENIAEAPRLQHVVWAPINPPPPPPPPPSTAGQAPSTTTMSPLPSGSIILNSLAGAAAGGAGKSPPTTSATASGSEHGSQANAGANGAASKGAYSLNQAIAFVHHNDIYYKPKVQGELVCRITQTGAAGVFYNGVPDWTYENVPELESRRSSIAFSPDSHFLAFLSFNDSEVNEYKYTWMGDDIKYPAVLSQRYPKAGARNPNVTVNVVNLAVTKYMFPTQIKLPAELGNGSYVGGLTWASPIDLSVTVTNRDQTKATTVICRAPHFHCQVVHTEVTINDGWVLPAERPIFSARIAAQLRSAGVLRPDADGGGGAATIADSQANVTNGQTTYEISNGGYLLKRLPVRDGEHGHYRHVVFISSLDRRPVPLTMGRFEVTEIVGWDEGHEIVYFMAAPEKRPGERHLYKISLKLNVTESNRTYITSTQPTCLTCDNTEATYRLHRARSTNAAEWQRGERWEDIVARLEPDDCIYDIPKNCLYNRVQFSRDYSYYVQECLGPEAPSVYLVETASNDKIFVLNAGDVLRHRLSQLAIPQMRTFSVEIRHGFHAQVRLFLPPGMREEEEVAFPLVLHVDASPGSQLVTERFQVDWNWYLCSQRSFIVAQIDGRGSGYQGELLRTQVHGKLGTVEVEDQLGVLTYLRDNLKFIDPLRICAFGWGYGGYASAMMLIDDSQQVLQCAVAINPIVSFGYHYSFFTERYIPLKGDYLRALQEADLTMKAGNIKGRNLMLMHGTADTLVHQEHTLMLVRALVDQQVKFRHQVYPDEDHAITRSLSHVYKTMEWYFDECFGPVDDNEWDPTGLFVFKQ